MVNVASTFNLTIILLYARLSPLMSFILLMPNALTAVSKSYISLTVIISTPTVSVSFRLMFSPFTVSGTVISLILRTLSDIIAVSNADFSSTFSPLFTYNVNSLFMVIALTFISPLSGSMDTNARISSILYGFALSPPRAHEDYPLDFLRLAYLLSLRLRCTLVSRKHIPWLIQNRLSIF